VKGKGVWIKIKVMSSGAGEGEVLVECLEFGARYGLWYPRERLAAISSPESSDPDFSGTST